MEPKIIRPFSRSTLEDLQRHIKEIRRLFEGIPWMDIDEPEDRRFNRYFWHNLPLLKKHHNNKKFISLASRVFGTRVKPSYVFLSMYGNEGVCPGHTDRPQCRFTLDLCISQKKPWPIMIGKDQNDRVGKKYILHEGEALAYSGELQFHYRKRIQKDNWVNLAFFHFVPVSFKLDLD